MNYMKSKGPGTSQAGKQSSLFMMEQDFQISSSEDSQDEFQGLNGTGVKQQRQTSIQGGTTKKIDWTVYADDEYDNTILQGERNEYVDQDDGSVDDRHDYNERNVDEQADQTQQRLQEIDDGREIIIGIDIPNPQIITPSFVKNPYPIVPYNHYFQKMQPREQYINYFFGEYTIRKNSYIFIPQKHLEYGFGEGIYWSDDNRAIYVKGPDKIEVKYEGSYKRFFKRRGSAMDPIVFILEVWDDRNITKKVLGCIYYDHDNETFSEYRGNQGDNDITNQFKQVSQIVNGGIVKTWYWLNGGQNQVQVRLKKRIVRFNYRVINKHNLEQPYYIEDHQLDRTKTPDKAAHIITGFYDEDFTDDNYTYAKFVLNRNYYRKGIKQQWYYYENGLNYFCAHLKYLDDRQYPPKQQQQRPNEGQYRDAGRS